MSRELDDLLRRNGWALFSGNFRRCRLCHKSITYEYGWFSPGRAKYHQGCVAKAPQVKRLVAKAKKKASDEAKP